MTTITYRLSERDWQQLADQQGRPCACNGDRLCLGHYGVMDNDARAQVRRKVGIAPFDGRRY